MLTSLKWYDRLWAALIFFTRLPFWRIHQPAQNAYTTVVEHWPLTGWLTAGVMAGVLYGASLLFNDGIAVILAISSRFLLTGALHEDGLADFFDGFGGGGSDRQRILAIMKDSHIGTYGVLALIVYFFLLFFTLSSMPPAIAAVTILAADPYAKMLSACIVQKMPYARTAETAKIRAVYRKFSWEVGLSLAIQGLLPLVIYLGWMTGIMDETVFSSPSFSKVLFACCMLFFPVLVVLILFRFIWNRLQGYTGDCCGALFLLTELSAYLVAACFLG